MTELRQREWLVAFQPRWDRREIREEVVHAPKWWDVPMALYKTHPESVIQGIWAVLDDWPEGPFPQPKRKDGQELCGECHLNPGEVCDICGAKKTAKEESWQPIETAPKDGSLINLKREINEGTLFQERGFYGIMAEDAPNRVYMLRDPLGRGLFFGSPISYSFPDTPRWLREGGRYCFPEPTHWRPLQEGDEL